jgi:hypothetical protein
MITYKITRFYLDDNKESEVVRTGLTLEQARKHCQSPSSKGDDWFDGYTKET